jgi:hypothetical protein
MEIKFTYYSPASRPRVELPTTVVVSKPFSACPACSSGLDRDEPHGTGRHRYLCGFTLVQTTSGKHAMESTCPFAMPVVINLRKNRIIKRKGMQQEQAPVSVVPGQFEVGQEVKWESQSSGTKAIKSGKVVVVVPAGERPEMYMPAHLQQNTTRGYGRERDHVSYLVQVGSKCYWPRVFLLSPVRPS